MDARSPDDRRGRRAVAVVLLALAPALLGLGCTGPGGSDKGKSPNVLLVVIDACRADRMGCYGFDRPTTPAIDRLAGDPDSTLFEHHYSQSSWTKPSTASLFTGLWVQQHRVMVGRQEAPAPGRLAVLGEELRTLAEAFREAGYTTFSLTENHQLNPVYGFDQGFDSYEMVTGGDRQLAQSALERLSGTERTSGTERPFFGYVHFVGCHYPFPEYLRDPGYLESYAPAYDEEARRGDGIDFTSPAIGRRINRGELELDEADARYLEVLYEAKLRNVDRIAIEPLLDGLAEAGLYDETLIVLTSDHGEELYEHRGFSHGHALWDEVIRVPMIVKFPRGGRPAGLGERESALSSTIDIFPTLAAVAGFAPPADGPGRNLAEAVDERFVFVENGIQGWAWIEGELKAMRMRRGGRELRHLYDLSLDPGERKNLIASRAAAFDRVLDLVRRLRVRHPPLARSGPVVENPELTPEALENLRSLGYVE